MSDPAFPQIRGDGYVPIPGLSKRELFAAMAMQGLLVGCGGKLGNEYSAYAHGPCNDAIVERALVVADKLLAALEKKP